MPITKIKFLSSPYTQGKTQQRLGNFRRSIALNYNLDVLKRKHDSVDSIGAEMFWWGLGRIRRSYRLSSDLSLDAYQQVVW